VLLKNMYTQLTVEDSNQWLYETLSALYADVKNADVKNADVKNETLFAQEYQTLMREWGPDIRKPQALTAPVVWDILYILTEYVNSWKSFSFSPETPEEIFQRADEDDALYAHKDDRLDMDYPELWSMPPAIPPIEGISDPFYYTCVQLIAYVQSQMAESKRKGTD